MESRNIDTSPDESAASSADSQASGSRGPLSIQLPIDVAVLVEVRRLAADKNTRINAIAEVMKQDPVISLELLRVANAMFYAEDRALISTVETAVVRLGAENVIQILNELATRPPLEDETVALKFEEFRQQARDTAHIAAYIARSRNKELEEEARTIGLMDPIGHMMALAHLGQRYLLVADGASRVTVDYRLKSKCNFNVRLLHLAYLRMRGIPQTMLSSLDKEATPKTQDEATRRFIVQAAIEIVAAFRQLKLQRYLDVDSLPSNSSFRLLNVDEKQYERIFNYCDDYLNDGRIQSGEMNVAVPDLTESSMNEIEELILGASVEEMSAEEHQTTAASVAKVSSATSHTVEEEPAAEAATPDEEAAAARALHESLQSALLEQELRDILDATAESQELLRAAAREAREEPSGRNDEPANTIKFHQKRFIEIDSQTSFAFTSIPYPEEPQFLITQVDEKTAPPPFATNQGQQVVSGFMRMLSEAKTKEELLEKVLQRFVSEKMFLRAALIKVADNHRSAHIQIAIGEDLENGAPIEFHDPLTPLASCFTKIRSFNKKGIFDIVAPLGISAYAISPLNLDSDSPVLLYADCGHDRSMPFEVRRLFRYVVGLINYVLPRLPGDVPGMPESTESH